MPYIGIDFGTSNSVVANFQYGKAEVVPNHEGLPWTPSIVTLRRDGSLAFGQEDEGRLVDALRGGGYVRLSLFAEQAGQVVGHILFSALPVETTAGPVSALALAPVAVHPDFQRRGIGSAPVRDGLAVWAKRLERGSFRLPAAGTDRVEMTTAELAALLAGIDLNTARRRVRYSRPGNILQNSEKNAPTIEHNST